MLKCCSRGPREVTQLLLKRSQNKRQRLYKDASGCNGETEKFCPTTFSTLRVAMKLFVTLLVCCGVALAHARTEGVHGADRITSLPGLDQMPDFDMYSGYLRASGTKRLFYWWVFVLDCTFHVLKTVDCSRFLTTKFVKFRNFHC